MEAEIRVYSRFDVPSSTNTTTSANKSFQELFLYRVKPNPTNKDKGKKYWGCSRAQVKKSWLVKCNSGIIKKILCWFVL